MNCHWCNKDKEDGDVLTECGFFVCRDCIRHMGQYKNEVSWQFFLATEVMRDVDDADEVRKELAESINDVLEKHGIDAQTVPDEWEVLDEN